jgi:hypothetical protein
MHAMQCNGNPLLSSMHVWLSHAWPALIVDTAGQETLVQRHAHCPNIRMQLEIVIGLSRRQGLHRSHTHGSAALHDHGLLRRAEASEVSWVSCVLRASSQWQACLVDGHLSSQGTMLLSKPPATLADCKTDQGTAKTSPRWVAGCNTSQAPSTITTRMRAQCIAVVGWERMRCTLLRPRRPPRHCRAPPFTACRGAVTCKSWGLCLFFWWGC